jgi:hypothetical protein
MRHFLTFFKSFPYIFLSRLLFPKFSNFSLFLFEDQGANTELIDNNTMKEIVRGLQ